MIRWKIIFYEAVSKVVLTTKNSKDSQRATKIKQFNSNDLCTLPFLFCALCV